jgi:hypothetical protein
MSSSAQRSEAPLTSLPAKTRRASLDRADEDICLYVVCDNSYLPRITVFAELILSKRSYTRTTTTCSELPPARSAA